MLIRKCIDIILLHVLIVLSCSWVQAEPIELNLEREHQEITDFTFIEDQLDQLDINVVKKRQNWQKEPSSTFNRGFSKSTWWVKLVISNPTDMPLKRFVEVNYPIIDYVSVYVENEKGDLIFESDLGDKYIYAKREIDHRNFIIPLEWPAQNQLTLYFKVKSEGSVYLPINIWNPQNFYSIEKTRSLVFGIYYGMMIAMILYNLFLFIKVREKSYLYYVLCVGAMVLMVAGFNGIAFQYLWPKATMWNDQAVPFFISICMLFSVLFAKELLSIEWSSKLGMTAKLIVSAAIAIIIGTFVFPYTYMIRVSILLIVFAAVFTVVIAFNFWGDENNLGKYYCFAWALLLIGAFVAALNRADILPEQYSTHFALQLGSVLQVIVFSFGLGERINLEKKLLYVTQSKLLENEKQLRETQESALETHRRTNEMLEQRVEERTRELQKVNETLKELSETDKLTGLKNRGYLDMEIDKEISHCSKWNKPLSVLLMDVDHFKSFNDKYGHLLGDKCLQEIAQKIESCVGKEMDCAARYGGEEFCIILPDTGKQGALAVAERIRKAVEKLVLVFEDQQIKVTISIGAYSVIPKQNQEAAELLYYADQALYASKEKGRNRVTFSERDQN